MTSFAAESAAIVSAKLEESLAFVEIRAAMVPLLAAVDVASMASASEVKCWMIMLTMRGFSMETAGLRHMSLIAVQ
jgi:hypothetical protein